MICTSAFSWHLDQILYMWFKSIILLSSFSLGNMSAILEGLNTQFMKLCLHIIDGNFDKSFQVTILCNYTIILCHSFVYFCEYHQFSSHFIPVFQIQVVTIIEYEYIESTKRRIELVIPKWKQTHSPLIQWKSVGDQHRNVCNTCSHKLLVLYVGMD